MAITIELPDDVADRLRDRTVREGTTVEAKAAELLADYAVVAANQSEFDRQMKIARVELDRFRATFKELAK